MKDSEIAMKEIAEEAKEWLKNYGNFSKNSDFSRLAKNIIELFEGESPDFHDDPILSDEDLIEFVYETNQTVVYSLVKIMARNTNEAIQKLRDNDSSIKYSNHVYSGNRETFELEI